jgi:hypothetical protein
MQTTQSKHPQLKIDAIDEIRRRKRIGLGVVSRLLELTDSSVEREVRESATVAVVNSGERSPRVKQLLLQSLKDNSVNYETVRSVGYLWAGDHEVLAEVQRLAKASCEDLQARAVRALGRLKANDPESRRIILSAGQSEKRDMRKAAIRAIRYANINTEESRRIIHAGLRSSDRFERLSAVEAIMDMNLHDPRTRQELEALLKKERVVEWVRIQADNALKQIDQIESKAAK